MKVTLEFNLPEEQDEFTLALHGTKYYGVLWELDQELRGILKYDKIPERVKTAEEAVDYIRNRIYSLIADRDFTLDEVT